MSQSKSYTLQDLAPSSAAAAKQQCMEADQLMNSQWGTALIVLLVVFVIVFVVLWFSNPTWVQNKDATGATTGVANFWLVAVYAAGAALVLAALVLAMRYCR